MREEPVRRAANKDYARAYARHRSALDRIYTRLRQGRQHKEYSHPILFDNSCDAVNLLFRGNEALFRAIFENTAVGIVLIDLSGRIVTLNPAFRVMLGYDPGELENTEFCRLAHSEDLTMIDYLSRELLTNQRDHYQVEERFIRKDTSTVWGFLTVSLVRNEFALPSFYIAMIEDITKRKQVEEALMAEKKRLAITLCSIGDGVIATDIQGIIVLINRAAENLTGWSQSEALGKPIGKIFFIINDRTSEDCENPVSKILRTGGGDYAENVVLVNSDGTERLISYSGAPICNARGGHTGVVLVFRDITEKRKLEEELLNSQKLESMGILAGGIAHDFNNILAGILANVQLAKVLLEKGRNISKNLNEMEEAVKRAADLTNQLLTFAKGGTPIKKPTSVGELIRETADFALRGSNVKCKYSLSEDLWSIEADSGQISQVINNLIINAYQAMPCGGQIEVEAENVVMDCEWIIPLPPGKYVKIIVRDHGVGIPETHLRKIFDPYFTTKQKGNGLGLATSYSIIRKHDGYINVESTPGIGTTFYIYLPASSARPRVYPPGRTFPGTGRILLMDDEEIIRETTGQILNHLGYRVVTVRNGAEVLEIYRQAMASDDKFDAVIMDLTIPGGLGGRETITELKKLDPEVRAVVSSGYSDDPVMANYHEYGFRGVVTKPYKMEELSEVLHQLLHRADGSEMVKSEDARVKSY